MYTLKLLTSEHSGRVFEMSNRISESNVKAGRIFHRPIRNTCIKFEKRFATKK